MSADILTQIVVREKEDIEKKKLSETHIELGGRGTEFTSDSGNCGGLNFAHSIPDFATSPSQFSWDRKNIQGSTKRRALGCEKFPPGPAWLLFSKTGPPFSGSL